MKTKSPASSSWSDFEYATEVQAAYYQGPRRRTHVFLFVVLALFAVGIFWADRAMVDEVTRGQGRVVPSSQLQVVQSLEGGIVESILVGEGDVVEAGQILLHIDDTGFSSTLGELNVQRYALLAQIARLSAEAAGASVVEFGDDVVANAPQVVANEQALFDARQAGLQNQLSILRQQADQREQELNEIEGQVDQYRSSLNIARQELASYLSLPSGLVPQVEVLRVRREVNDLQGQLDAAERSKPRAESAIREAFDRIQEQFLTFQSEARAELNRKRAELSVIEETLRGATDRVVRTDIRSPVHGIINKLNVTTVGGVLQPGQAVIEIVPLEDTLLVEAQIRPSDVAFIRPGQEATVKITAYDFSIYGGLRGLVERISADTTTDQETGEAFYRIFVRTEVNYLGTSEQPLPIIPGMVASVDILTGQKSILHYILKPVIKARDEALRER